MFVCRVNKSSAPNPQILGVFDGGIRVIGDDLDPSGSPKRFCVANDYSNVWINAVAAAPPGFIPNAANQNNLGRDLTQSIHVGAEILTVARTRQGTLEVIGARISGPKKGSGFFVVSDGAGIDIKMAPLEAVGYSKGLNDLLAQPSRVR